MTQPNQRQASISSTGKFKLDVKIEQQTTNPKYKGALVWKVCISDRNGKLVYKDEDSEFVANLKIYWGWDDREQVWVYNSDDGKIWRWNLKTDKWRKIESRKSDGIPDFILPNYAKTP